MAEEVRSAKMKLYKVIGKAFSQTAGGKIMIEQYVGAINVEQAAIAYSEEFSGYEITEIKYIEPLLMADD